MSRHREDSYIFCSALMRAGERTLLPEADIMKTVEAAGVDEAMAVLAEYGYGDGKPLENPRDFVKVLNAEEARVYDYVFSALPEKEDLEMLKCPRDYHNAKAILKAEFLGLDYEKYMIGGGRTEPGRLAAMIRERNLVFLSPEMREAIREAEEIFGKGKDPQEIDIILDKACYSQMLRESEEAGNEFIKGYVKLQIDILNVRTFVRLRQMGKPWSFFTRVFLEGGDIQQSLFVSAYEESYQQVADKLRPYGFGDIIEKGAAEVRNTGLYSLMEKMCDDRLMRYIKDAKYVPFGPEAAAAFLLAKESEIKNLRMILTRKIAGTPKEVISERLRETYV